jgi:hypothetical protein
MPRLDFSGTPLAEAIAIIGRHSGVRLMLGDPALGKVQVSGVLRKLSIDADGISANAYGGGASVTGSAQVRTGNMLLFGANVGSGIARYIVDTGGSNLDATVGPNGKLNPLSSRGGYVGYTHYWTHEWRSNLVSGYLGLAPDSSLTASALRRSVYDAVNLIWSPYPSLTVGVEAMYGQRQQQDGRDGGATRFQGSMQYLFVK